MYLRHSRVHAEDCVACETQDAKLTVIERDIQLDGTLGEDQRARLLAIADRCPVHLTLTSKMEILYETAMSEHRHRRRLTQWCDHGAPRSSIRGQQNG